MLYPAFPVRCDCGYVSTRRNPGRRFRCPSCWAPLVAGGKALPVTTAEPEAERPLSAGRIRRLLRQGKFWLLVDVEPGQVGCRRRSARNVGRVAAVEALAEDGEMLVRPASIGGLFQVEVRR